MKIRFWFLILSLLTFFTYLNGQVPTPYHLQSDSANLNTGLKGNYQPLGFNFTMGTSIGSYGPGNFSSTYIAPEINYRLNTKWKVSGGIILFNNYSSPASGGFKETSRPYPGTPSNLYIFGNSTYQVSEKLSLHGSVFKNISSTPNTPLVNPMMNFSSNFASMGFNFQLNENISFGAQFSFSEGYNPYYNSFYSPGFGTFNQYRNRIPFNF
jgi:hypothetical protein